MTRQDFTQRLEALVREEKRVSVISIVTLVGLLIIIVVFGKWIRMHLGARWLLAFYIGYFCLVSGMYIMFLRAMKRRATRFGLVCAACGKSLTGSTAQIAVVTGNCGHCGASVFDAEPSDG